MFTFAEETQDEIILHNRFRVGTAPIPLEKYEIHLQMLKILAKTKEMDLIQFAKRCKISLNRLLKEAYYLPTEFFTLDDKTIFLSNNCYNLTEREIIKKFKNMYNSF